MVRTYKGSHPFITFEFDMSAAPPAVWLMMGGARTQCMQIAQTPMKPEVRDQLHRMMLAKGAQATTAIEGNTLSEEDVVKRMDGELELPPSTEYMGREVDNVIAAFNSLLVRLYEGEELVLTPGLLNEFNTLILEGLSLPNGIIPGMIRTHPVKVGNYICAPAEDCTYLVNELCDWMNSPVWDELNLDPMMIGIIKAIIVHVYFVWIHPYGDGNGRTARLIEAMFMLNAGITAPAAQLLSNYYNRTRNEYYQQLEASTDDLMSFIVYALTGLTEELDGQLSTLKKNQIALNWDSYVYEQFSGKNSDAAMRQRRILLDLGRQRSPVARKDIPTLSAKLAKRYATVGPRTLSRDLNALANMGLIDFDENDAVYPCVTETVARQPFRKPDRTK